MVVCESFFPNFEHKHEMMTKYVKKLKQAKYKLVSTLEANLKKQRKDLSKLTPNIMSKTKASKFHIF